jgi:hypothetical protein
MAAKQKVKPEPEKKMSVADMLRVMKQATM